MSNTSAIQSLDPMVENHMMHRKLATLIKEALVPANLNIGFVGLFDTGKKAALIASVKDGMKSDEKIITNICQCLELLCSSEKFTAENINRLVNEFEPDRIVAELKSSEILEIAEVMQTAPSISLLSTVHADNIEQFRFKIWKMFAVRGLAMPDTFLNQQISELFDILIFFKQLWDGQRVLDSVVEVGQGEYRTIYSFDYVLNRSSHASPYYWKMGQNFSNEMGMKITKLSGFNIPGNSVFS